MLKRLLQVSSWLWVWARRAVAGGPWVRSWTKVRERIKPSPTRWHPVTVCCKFSMKERNIELISVSDGRNMSGSAGRIQCQRWSGEVGGSPVLGWGATIMIGTGENPQSWWAPEQTWKKRKWYLIWIGYCAESVIQFLREQTKKTMSIVSWIKQRRGSKDTKYLQFFSLIPIKTLPPGSCLPPQESLPPSAARFPKIYIWREE